MKYAQDILDVKSGKYTEEEILKWSDDLVEECRGAYEATSLRREPLSNEIEKFVMEEVEFHMLG